MAYEFSKIEDALEAIAQGRVVIVVDDEKRENEGISSSPPSGPRPKPSSS